MTIGGPLIGSGTGIFTFARTVAPVGLEAEATPDGSNTISSGKPGNWSSKVGKYFFSICSLSISCHVLGLPPGPVPNNKLRTPVASLVIDSLNPPDAAVDVNDIIIDSSKAASEPSPGGTDSFTCSAYSSGVWSAASA